MRRPVGCSLLTLSPPIPLRLYTLPYGSNPPFLIFDIRALWRSVLSARAPECQKLKMVGQTSMALDPSNTSSLEQLALKGLRRRADVRQLLFIHLYISRPCCIYIPCLDGRTTPTFVPKSTQLGLSRRLKGEEE